MFRFEVKFCQASCKCCTDELLQNGIEGKFEHSKYYLGKLQLSKIFQNFFEVKENYGETSIQNVSRKMYETHRQVLL